MRFPKRLTLPFGYTVAIKEVTDGEMRDMDDCDVRTSDGCWDVDSRTIYIVKTLSPRRKRYILGHELFHALIDYQHHILDEGRAKP